MWEEPKEPRREEQRHSSLRTIPSERSKSSTASHLELPHKNTMTGWLKQQKLISSLLWWLEVQDQVVGQFGFC